MLEDDLHREPDFDLICWHAVDRRARASNHVADQPEVVVFLQAHYDHVVRRQRFEGGKERTVRHHERPHPTPTRHPLPSRVERAAPGAHRAGWKATPAAVDADLHPELALGGPLPEG